VARAGLWIDRIRINRVEPVGRGGAIFWRKERMAAARWLLPLANRFFEWAGNPVNVVESAAAWRERELAMYGALHGCPGAASAGDGDAAVWLPGFPGEDLSRLLDSGKMREEMFGAAGRELRRVHGLIDPDTGEAFSHGDPHLANFIFDCGDGRARLIDFEVRHRTGLSARARFADDLLVFLQDLAGRIEREEWLPGALAFLVGYGGRAPNLTMKGDEMPDGCESVSQPSRPWSGSNRGETPVTHPLPRRDRNDSGEMEVIGALAERLSVPGGLGRVWWAVRTSYLPGRELRERLGALRDEIGKTCSTRDGRLITVLR
jgi:hypothetical protein